MKAYLLVSGTIFAIFAVMHVFITYEYWRSGNPEAGSIVIPALLGVVAAALAIWGFGLIRRVPTAP
jgi:hypothetical protein